MDVATAGRFCLEWRDALRALRRRTSVPTATLATWSSSREEAEAAGWEALLLWDHLAFVWGPPAADPWVTLAAVAARTERSLLLGTNVTPLPRRRPHVLAHQVATLDVLSGGARRLRRGDRRDRRGVHRLRRARRRTHCGRIMLDEGLEVLAPARGRATGSTTTAALHGRRSRRSRRARNRSACRSGSAGTARRRSAGQPVRRLGGRHDESGGHDQDRPTTSSARSSPCAIAGARRIRRCRDGTRGPGRSRRLRGGGRDLVAGDVHDCVGTSRRCSRWCGRDRPASGRACREPRRRAHAATPPGRTHARCARRGGRPGSRAPGGSGRPVRTTARAPRSRRAPCRRRAGPAWRPFAAARVVGEAERGAVERVHRQTDRPPVLPRDGLAEQRRVRVVAAEDQPVERFGCRPDEGSRRSRCCSARAHAPIVLPDARRRCTSPGRPPPAAARRRASRGRDAEPARPGRTDR